MARKQLTADEILRKRANTNTRHTVARILATFDRATESDRANGREWYDVARDAATELAPNVGTIEHAAAIIAHMSPRTSWERNVRVARHLALTGERHPHAMSANYVAAVRAALSSDPLTTLNGPKVRRFAANILGDETRVTVDVWAARVALGRRADTERVLNRVGVYDAIERAYAIAAERRGVTPAVMQATTWVVARNGRAA